MKTAPCKDCPDRTVGCHASCEKYIAFAAERERIRTEKWLDSQNETIPNQKKIKNINRKHRRR